MIIIELPTISLHPKGSSVKMLELITPTTISVKNKIEHRPAPNLLGAHRITIPVGMK